jgi:hypothetical protein
MKKTIRMTESDLTNLVKRVIKEQSAQIKSVTDTMSKPSSQGSAQLRSVTDTMSKPSSKQSVGSLTDKVQTPSSELWVQYFPCLTKEAKVYPTYAVAGGKTLLYQWNTDSDNEFIRNMANEGNFGEVKGGGKYWCSSKDKNKIQIISFVK